MLNLDDILSYEIEYSFIKILDLEISGDENFENLKYILWDYKDFRPRIAYQAIDVSSKLFKY